MPNPKRRHSNQRTRKRRTHDKAQVTAAYMDKNTQSEHRAHKIDPKTGTYKGKQILTIKVKDKKSK